MVRRTPLDAGELSNALTAAERLNDERFEFLRRMTDEVDRRYKERFEALDKAVTKSEMAMDRRFESFSDLKAQLNDYMPRSESSTLLDALEGKLDQSNRTTAARLDQINGAVTALNNVLTALRSSLAGQNEGSDEVQAQIEQRNKDRERSRNWVLALIAAAVGLVGLVLTAFGVFLGLYFSLHKSDPPAAVVPAAVVTTTSTTGVPR